MTNLKAGIIAGLAATVVLSVMMVIKSMLGILPALDVAKMLSSILGASLVIGWLAHFVIGTIAWGGGFALLYEKLPGSGAVAKGLVFGIAAWLGMMIVVMPIARAGFFGLGLGIMAPIMTLMLHIVFGAVLGAVFKSLSKPEFA